MPSILRRMVGILLVLLVCALVPPSGAAAADNATEEEVYNALGIDEVPGSYVILVDISGSMRGERYANVKRAIREFLASVAPTDYVSLVTFADSVRVVAQGQAGRAPGAMVDALPAEADGVATDIGSALEEAVQILAQSGAPAIGTVVLLTDGQHYPPAGSPYPFESGYAWDQTRKAADALPQEVLTAFAVPLSGVTGAPLLAKVFPDATILPTGSIDKLTTLLAAPKAAVQAAKARSILEPELRTGVVVEWPVVGPGRGTTELTVHLRARTSHIPLVVTDLAISTSVPGVSVQVPSGPIAIAAGEAAAVTVTVNWETGPRSWRPTARIELDIPMTLTATVTSPWASVLEQADMTFAPTLTEDETVLAGSAENGSPQLWTGGGIAAGVLLVILIVLRHRRLRPALRGVLTAETGRTLPLHGAKATISDATLGISGVGQVRLVRQRTASAPALEIEYSRDGQAASRETKRAEAGETVEVSGVRFTWRDS